MSELRAGTILADTYELVRELGRGGVGSVWIAKHLRLPKEVAVKVLHSVTAEGDELFIRFRREAEIASQLDHPNIVRAFDFNVHETGDPFIVLELLKGGDLSAVIGSTPMPLSRVETLLGQVVSALSAAHAEGIVHRDLKPPNIFICEPDTPRERVKVLDFGISKILHSQSLQTASGMMMGTPNYMAPEQVRGEIDMIGPWTDQFALALVVFEMLSGQRAYEGTGVMNVLHKIVNEEARDLRSLRGDLRSSVYLSLERAMQKKPEDRFPSVDAFFEAFLLGMPEAGALTELSPHQAETRPAKQAQVPALVATFSTWFTSWYRGRMIHNLGVAAGILVITITLVLLIRPPWEIVEESGGSAPPLESSASHAVMEEVPEGPAMVQGAAPDVSVAEEVAATPPTPSPPARKKVPPKPRVSSTTPEQSALLKSSEAFLKQARFKEAEKSARMALAAGARSKASGLLARIRCEQRDFVGAAGFLRRARGAAKRASLRHCRELGFDLDM